MAVMGEYTRGEKRLHMAYSFEMLSPEFTAKHFRRGVEKFFKAASDGWPCWSFSNHDVIRHVTRWRTHATDEGALARQAAALLLSLRGSVCLYQGEELGQTESELTFEELTDPPGIRFWPEYKGRDGCRTPMVWDDGNAYSGFSTAEPWLPIKPPQAARHVSGQEDDPASVLSFYRRFLAWRRSRPVLRAGGIRFFRVDEPVLAYLRQDAGASLACVFNLSPGQIEVKTRGLALIEDAPSQAAGLIGNRLTLGANGFAFLEPVPGAGEPRVSFKA
jgi:alpha-glucosidase